MRFDCSETSSPNYALNEGDLGARDPQLGNPNPASGLRPTRTDASGCIGLPRAESGDSATRFATRPAQRRASSRYGGRTFRPLVTCSSTRPKARFVLDPLLVSATSRGRYSLDVEGQQAMSDRSAIEWTEATWNPGDGMLQGQPWLRALLRRAPLAPVRVVEGSVASIACRDERPASPGPS